jgi:hypothetical protein
MKHISQTLPKAQKDIIVYALNKREQQLKEDVKRYTGTDQMEMHHELFDILTLKALLQYEVNVVLTDSQHKHFTSVNGVDYPEYL